MNEARQRDYLQQVLTLDPRSGADAILRRRREFLQPGDVYVADLAEGPADEVDLRTRLLYRLSDVRRDFWKLEPDELAMQLTCLQGVNHVEIRTAANRLQQVAAQRESIRRLMADSRVHPAFGAALAKILISSPAEANRLREQEHRWMRPEQNPQFASAWRTLQGTAHFIYTDYPEVFRLEESWLTELLEYDPRAELFDESGHTILGLLMIGGAFFTLLLVIGIVVWVFS